MNKRVELQIKKIYDSVFKKIFGEQELKDLSTGDRTAIELKLAKLQNSPKFNDFCKKFAKELAKAGLSHERGIWRKYYEVAQKAHYVGLPIPYSAFEQQQLEKAVRHNFEMIKSIPQDIMEIVNAKYVDTLIDQVAKGKLVRGSFQKELEKHEVKRAKLIARTETAKLQTAITENRSRDLGSVVYRWKSSRDIRTRPSHKEMNGVIVFWRQGLQKPLRDNMRGNAGELPNCRCDAQPIFDESDLGAPPYKIYDYRTDKITEVSKQKLLKYIDIGEIRD